MSTRKKKLERLQIEANLEEAIERGEAVEEFRADHDDYDELSFGGLKNVENQMYLEDVRGRLQSAFDQHGVGSDQFNGTLYEYLSVLNAVWYKRAHEAYREHSEDSMMDLFIEITDPANRHSGRSVYQFSGEVPIHHWVNSVIKRFKMEREGDLADEYVKHFAIIDDGSFVKRSGTIHVGQIEKEAINPTPKEQPYRMGLKSFGVAGTKFIQDFKRKSAIHFIVVSMLLEQGDLSGREIAQSIRTTPYEIWELTPYSGRKTVMELGPFEVDDRKIERIKKAFFDGLRDIAKTTLENQERRKKGASDLNDPAVLSDRFYRRLGARAGKPRRRHTVETEESRRKAKEDPNYDGGIPGPRFGTHRRRPNMDSIEKNAR